MEASISALQLELETARQRILQLEQQLNDHALNLTDALKTGASGSNLRPLIDSSEDLIWYVDLDNRIILINRAAITLFEEHLGIDIRPGMAVTELFPTDQLNYIKQAFRNVRRGKALRINYPGIDQRDYAAKLHPVKEGDTVIGVSVFVRDITRTLQLQEDLRCYKQIVASSPNMIALLDHNHCFQMVNDAYLKAFNRQRRELIGTPIRELLGEEEYNQFTRPNLERAFSGDHVQYDGWFNFEGVDKRFIAMSYLPLQRGHHSSRHVVINARDISALKHAETDRQRIFDLSLDMLCIFNFSGKFVETNPAWQQIMGWSKKELQQKTWLELMAEEDYQSSRQVAEKLLQGQSIRGFEARCRGKNGAFKWLSWSAYPDLDRRRIFATVRDISPHKKMQEELLKLATTDPLTGTGNRRNFIDRAGVELSRTHRYGLQMAVLMIDVDHFKEVNDTYGHGAGDEVLKQLVDCCHKELRETDIFGRFGGEEFAAVLVDTGRQDALNVCTRLLKSISELPIKTSVATINITASLGMSMHQEDDTSIESLLKRADDALYQAKNSGRNQLVVV